MTRNRNQSQNPNQIRVSDEIPICGEIRQMAENLQNNDFSNLVVARPLQPGMHMMGIANENLLRGDIITFERDEHGIPHARKLTPEEMESVQSPHSINRVETVARVMRNANTDEIIEFIIDTSCEAITINDINALPITGYINSTGLHKLDEDYPHICYKCKKKLKYLEAWHEVKKTKMTEEKFQHLWELEQIEFYCCSCYDKEVRKENPATYSISTPFRNAGGDMFDALRQSLNSANRRSWTIFPNEVVGSLEMLPSLQSVPIYTNTLNALQRFAEIQFGPLPQITDVFTEGETFITYIEHRFDINVCGNEPHTHRRIRMVVPMKNHPRFDNTPPQIDLTVHSDYITTMGVAILVAELVFHWASAKLLLHPEGEEWLELNGSQRQGEIKPFLDSFIAERNRPIDLIGEMANEQFQMTYPNFPHIWDDHLKCKLCGLKPDEIYMEVEESE